METVNIPAPGRDFTDAEIRSFVGDLESLPGGELTVSLLVGCGQRAVQSLREYLLEGVPRGIFQPRQRAVEALGRLGAKSVLFEYLSQVRQISDPEARFGEEAVENTAARWLGESRTEEVYEFLKKLTERRMLAGAIEALGRFERTDAAETFVRALGDDVCRPAADEALSRVAARVKPVLLRAALPKSEVTEEKPSERRRRRGVVKVLSELTFTAEEWNGLRPLLDDEDKDIALMAARVAVESAPQEEKERAARFLIHSLGKAHWFTQIQIQDCLHRNYEQVGNVVAEELAMRRLSVDGEPLADQVVRVLSVIQSSEGAPGLPERGSHGKREHTTGGA
jgi:hypothetical protein